MKRKFIIPLMLLLMLSTLVGCSLNKDISSKNTIKEINLLKNIETIDTMEILFDKEAGPMWSGRYEIALKDKKIIMDIANLINKSTLLNDEEKETRTKKLGGGAKKDNKIKFFYNNDKVIEFSFSYDHLPFDVGLLNFENKTYEIPYEAVTYMDNLSEHKNADRLRETLPDFMQNRSGARGIIVRYEDKIIGAYIDAGRHSSFACSLDKKSLENITKKPWDQWILSYMTEMKSI